MKVENKAIVFQVILEEIGKTTINLSRFEAQILSVRESVVEHDCNLKLQNV